MQVSIIVTSYNYAKYIRDTLDSLIDQTFTDWEALVIDDGSKDNSVEIISEYAKKDSRIKLLQHPGGVNKGLPASLQFAIREAKGEYIAFCESDDSLHPESLETQVGILSTYPTVALSFTSVELIGAQKDIRSYQSHLDTVRTMLLYSGEPSEGRSIFTKLDPVFTFSCTMARAELLKQCDFRSPVSPFLDWWLWLQICYNNNFVFINIPLTKWRIHGNSYTHTLEDKAVSQRFFRRKAMEFLKDKDDHFLKLTPRKDQILLSTIIHNYREKCTLFNTVNVPFFYREDKSIFYEIRFFGMLVKRSFYDARLNALSRKRARYRFYSFFPIPGLQKKLKAKYKELKSEFCLQMDQSFAPAKQKTDQAPLPMMESGLRSVMVELPDS